MKGELGFLDMKELMRLLNFRSANTIRKKIRNGELPEPRMMGPCSPRWDRREVLEALERHPLSAIHRDARPG